MGGQRGCKSSISLGNQAKKSKLVASWFSYLSKCCKVSEPFVVCTKGWTENMSQ